MRNAIAHRVRTGRLHRIHRGVYSVGHPVLSGNGLFMAAVLACGPGAALSHRAAADHWDIWASANRTVDVTISTRAGRRPRAGIRVHRSALPATEVTCHLGIPVTTPARILLDLAAGPSVRRLERMIERLEVLRLFDLDAVMAVLRAHPRRPGGPALAAVLADLRGPEPTRSELERMFLDLCQSAGLPRPRVNTMVGPFEVDFFWPEQRLAVECDSRTWHGTAAAFERDRDRDARLTAADYRAVRFTYRKVEREPLVVAGRLRELLEPGRKRTDT
jgi:very-short-patch-repair endonuclease